MYTVKYTKTIAEHSISYKGETFNIRTVHEESDGDSLFSEHFWDFLSPIPSIESDEEDDYVCDFIDDLVYHKWDTFRSLDTIEIPEYIKIQKELNES